MLAILAAATALLGARLGLWGQGEGRRRGARGVADDRVAVGPSAVDDAQEDPGTGPKSDGGDDPRSDGSRASASRSDLARGRQGGDPEGNGNNPVLALVDELERHVDATLARARESVVALEYSAGDAPAGRRRIATGVVINARGEILSVRIDPPPGGPPPGPGAAGTKGREPSRIVARDYRGRRHSARWVAADPHTGLTLLSVRPRVLRPIQASVDGPKLASQVFVVGNPFGMGHSVNRGHVAGLDRVLELGPRQLGGLIQVQAPFYPGDSGAAVVDVRGRWLGLIRGGLAVPAAGRAAPEGDQDSPSPSQRGARHREDPEDAVDPEPDTDFGFAIPTRDALWIAEQLRLHGRVDRAALGVRLEMMPVLEGPTAAPDPPPTASGSNAGPAASWRGAAGTGTPAAVNPTSDATATVAAEHDLPLAPASGDGARIRDVVDGMPAARAGLRPGDRIVALDDQPIRSRNDLIDRLDRIPAGTAVVLGVVRGGDESDRSRFDVRLRTGSRSGQPDPGPNARQEAAARPRPAAANVAVTPTVSQVAPTGPPSPPSSAPDPAPSPSGGSNPAPSSPPDGSSPPSPKPGEARPGPISGDVPSSSPRRDSPAPATTDRPEAPIASPGSPASLNELKLTLPRAVVERIEHLERRIDELEHFRAGSGAGSGPGAASPGERDPRAPLPTAGRERERSGRPGGPSRP